MSSYSRRTFLALLSASAAAVATTESLANGVQPGVEHARSIVSRLSELPVDQPSSVVSERLRDLKAFMGDRTGFLALCQSLADLDVGSARTERFGRYRLQPTEIALQLLARR